MFFWKLPVWKCNNLKPTTRMLWYLTLNMIDFFLYLSSLLSWPENGLWTQHDRRDFTQLIKKHVKWHVDGYEPNKEPLCKHLQLNPCETLPLACCKTWPTSDIWFSFPSQVKLLFPVLVSRCQNPMDVALTSLVSPYQKGYVSSVWYWYRTLNLYKGLCKNDQCGEEGQNLYLI